MKWRWNSESPVFDAVAWLQGLWASRSVVCIQVSCIFIKFWLSRPLLIRLTEIQNKQNRSFIEQQMVLYEYHRAEGCFGKDDEVLHRDVEVVEFLNDLLDMF